MPVDREKGRKLRARILKDWCLFKTDVMYANLAEVLRVPNLDKVPISHLRNVQSLVYPASSFLEEAINLLEVERLGYDPNAEEEEDGLG
jgi:hypothetical protein